MKEKTEYENLMDELSTDNLLRPDEGVLFESEDDNLVLEKFKQEKNSNHWKSIYVHFRNADDYAEFAKLIGQILTLETKSIDYPFRSKTLFGDSDEGRVVFTPKKKKAVTKHTHGLIGENIPEWKKHWKNMPDFVNDDNPTYKTLIVNFADANGFQEFQNKISQAMTEKTKSIWHPKLNIQDIKGSTWTEESGKHTLPKYPICIVSKGRHESMITSRALSKIKIPHYIAIEPQDEENYEKALDIFGLREYVTLLILPFSNHGDGPGRARNWWWDYSKDVLGAKRHWVMDDNIEAFYRLHENKRIRVNSGAMFRSCEDFVDRYENIPMAGLQYRFFIAPNQSYPPYVTNTRIYSCNLIENSCKHRWRGRYNEDTILSLDILKDGDCTVQFNHFLQGKMATQTVSGGNTAEFYHAEFTDGADSKELMRKKYHEKGTLNKSQMLVDAHPDVSKLVWKYDRWHHYVDYNPFKKLKLKLKTDVDFSEERPEYMNLILRKIES